MPCHIRFALHLGPIESERRPQRMNIEQRVIECGIEVIYLSFHTNIMPIMQLFSHGFICREIDICTQFLHIYLY